MDSFSLAIQNERDRLRREADKGTCPICGRLRDEDRERLLREYAEVNAKLHSDLAKR
jgi:hypothetical protein